MLPRFSPLSACTVLAVTSLCCVDGVFHTVVARVVSASPQRSGRSRPIFTDVDVFLLDCTSMFRGRPRSLLPQISFGSCSTVELYLRLQPLQRHARRRLVCNNTGIPHSPIDTQNCQAILSHCIIVAALAVLLATCTVSLRNGHRSRFRPLTSSFRIIGNRLTRIPRLFRSVLLDVGA